MKRTYEEWWNMTGLTIAMIIVAYIGYDTFIKQQWFFAIPSIWLLGAMSFTWILIVFKRKKVIE